MLAADDGSGAGAGSEVKLLKMLKALRLVRLLKLLRLLKIGRYLQKVQEDLEINPTPHLTPHLTPHPRYR